MPAIQVKRVRKQIQSLIERIDDPQEFLRYLLKLFELYADRTYRVGQATEPSPLIATYNIPPPLIHELVQEIGKVISAKPDEGLILIDMLWSEPAYETHVLAIRLLAFLPLSTPEMANHVADRAKAWMQPDIDLRLVNIMMKFGISQIVSKAPNILLSLAHGWLQSSHPFTQDLGLRALAELVNQPYYTNFSPIFKFITPMVRESPAAIRPSLANLLQQLGRRSPQETAFYFQGILKTEISPQTAMLIRMCLGHLPSDFAENIRRQLR